MFLFSSTAVSKILREFIYYLDVVIDPTQNPSQTWKHPIHKVVPVLICPRCVIGYCLEKRVKALRFPVQTGSLFY
jgi:hypothetical protein